MSPLTPCTTHKSPESLGVEGRTLMVRTQGSEVLTEAEEHHFSLLVTVKSGRSVPLIETGPASLPF